MPKPFAETKRELTAIKEELARIHNLLEVLTHHQPADKADELERLAEEFKREAARVPIPSSPVDEAQADALEQAANRLRKRAAEIRKVAGRVG